MRKINIVLLFASIGSGHKRAAQAMEEAFIAMDGKCSVQSIDILDFLPAKLVKLFLAMYFFSLHHCPGIYECVYKWGNRKSGLMAGRELMRRYLAYKLKCVFKGIQPEIIISTHAAAASAADYLIRMEKLKTYHFGVVTDFTIHRFWVNQTILRYFIYDASMLNKSVKSWIDKDKICSFGIPILKEFEFGINRLKEQGFKTVLLMGGGEGLMPMVPIVEMLEKVRIPLRIYVVTGHNKVIQEKLRARKQSLQQRLCVIGFVNNIADLMKKADLIITKAGGVSVSEALRIGVPIFLYNPLPGQERVNADFLLSCGAAIEIKKLSSIIDEVDKIFGTDESALHRLQFNINNIAKTNAAEKIAYYVINKLYNRSTKL